jgi:hypothetical protein
MNVIILNLGAYSPFEGFVLDKGGQKLKKTWTWLSRVRWRYMQMGLTMILFCLCMFTFQCQWSKLQPVKSWIRHLFIVPQHFTVARDINPIFSQNLAVWIPLHDFSEKRDNHFVAKTFSFNSPVKGLLQWVQDPISLDLMILPQDDKKLYAPHNGLVIYAGCKKRTGLTMVIKHPYGYESIYGRLSEMFVQKHDWVSAGEVIGHVGIQPCSFGFLKNGQLLNPLEVIRFD